ncbi:MAG TPA: Zn-ribbon domain-containing OB-fold protein [Acidimicrobiales bacterium]|nr:Zn-ribbon domain-containing OB-fold protein [Acidimicrobiales bacterium]
MSTTEAPAPKRPQPTANPASGPFWEATRDRRYLVQFSTDCGRAVFYPRTVCPHCGGTAMQWRPSTGAGTVYTFTVEHRPAPAFGAEPYVVALVALDEGIRVMTNLVDVDPGQVRVGMPVELTWAPLDDGRNLPLWRPAGA